MTTGESYLENAINARQALKTAQDRLHVCAAIPGEIVEAEGRHRDALQSAGCSMGPLHGLPIVVKDIIDVAGMPTRAGSDIRENPSPAAQDATVVAQLRAAGAITVGKTNTVEFAFGGWGTNATQGTPRNPWRPDDPHTPGGSSSGTGVAVGARLVAAGLGTDTGGSVRIPAAFCGCVGLKTSIGLVSRAGVVPLSDSFDTIGPLTDTVLRSAQMLDAMTGQDRADPTTMGITRIDPFAGLDRGVAGLRLGILSDDALEDARPDVREALAQAIALLHDAGATMVPVTLPKTFADYQVSGTAIISSDAYAFHADMTDSNQAPLNDTTRIRILAGKNLTARDRVLAQRARQQDIADYLAAVDRCDAVILPTAPSTAIPLSTVNEDDYSVSLYTRPANYLDLAAVSVPIGLSPAGLPTALQIMVRRFDDPLALRIAKAFEEARGPMPHPPGGDT